MYVGTFNLFCYSKFEFAGGWQFSVVDDLRKCFQRYSYFKYNKKVKKSNKPQFILKYIIL